MIKIGDIVYQVSKGGLIHSKPSPIKNRLGLVIKEEKLKGAIAQFYVQFNQDDPKWYYQHDLQRIGGERNEDV